MAAQPIMTWEPIGVPDAGSKSAQPTTNEESRQPPVSTRAPFTVSKLFCGWNEPWEELFPVYESKADDELSEILSKIDKLFVGEEEDEDVVATEYAYRAASSVVESAYGRLRAEKVAANIPVPIITTDDRGGIRLSWQAGDKHVRTAFAPSPGQRSYLYFESPAEHDVIDLQPSNLSGKLDWMLKR